MTYVSKNDIREALKSSLQKWKDIRESRVPLLEGTDQCALCKLFLRHSSCGKCPLECIRQGCLTNKGGVWVQYRNLVVESYSQGDEEGSSSDGGVLSVSLESVGEPWRSQLTPLADEMAGHLERLLDMLEEGSYIV